jgi:hypothetical protein
MSEWISVNDRLPELAVSVLAWKPCGPFVGFYDDDTWTVTTDQYSECGITHWMPLPKPPTPDLTIEEALKLAVMDLSLFANYFCGGTRATHEGISDACGRVVRYREVLERAGKW